MPSVLCDEFMQAGLNSAKCMLRPWHEGHYWTTWKVNMPAGGIIAIEKAMTYIKTIKY
jgi:hypothetical protein